MKIFSILLIVIIILWFGCQKGTTESDKENTNIIQWKLFTSSPDDYIEKIEIDSAGNIFASCGDGLFISMDDGHTWGLIYNRYNIRDFGVSPIDKRIYISAIFSTGWIEYSTNNGLTWNSPSTFPGPAWITSFLFLDNGSVLCGSFYMEETKGGLLISDDGGDEWIESELSREISVNALNKNSRYVFAGLTEYDSTYLGHYKIYRSSNNGNQWESPSFAEIENEIQIIAIDSENNIYLGTYGGGIWRSTDDGQTWYCLD